MRFALKAAKARWEPPSSQPLRRATPSRPQDMKSARADAQRAREGRAGFTDQTLAGTARAQATSYLPIVR